METANRIDVNFVSVMVGPSVLKQYATAHYDGVDYNIEDVESAEVVTELLIDLGCNVFVTASEESINATKEKVKQGDLSLP